MSANTASYHRRQQKRSKCRSRAGSVGPYVFDIWQALRPDRDVHLRSRLHLDGELRIQDHLHRRRRGHPALSRLSDRAAGRARRLPRDLLPAALRRTADQAAEGRFRLPRHAPHDGARADERGSSRASAATRIRWRSWSACVGALSAFYHDSTDISDPQPAHGRLDADDRQDADARRHGVQVHDRPALRLSEERPRLYVELPAHVLRGAVRGVQGQPGAVARAGPHLHPPCRPRAERLDLDGAPRRLVGRQPVRLHRGRHRLPVGPGARRRQRGGAARCWRDRHRRPHPANTSPAPRTRTTRSA